MLEWVAIPPPGDLPNPVIKSESESAASSALQVDSVTAEPLGKPRYMYIYIYIYILYLFCLFFTVITFSLIIYPFIHFFLLAISLIIFLVEVAPILLWASCGLIFIYVIFKLKNN